MLFIFSSLKNRQYPVGSDKAISRQVYPYLVENKNSYHIGGVFPHLDLQKITEVCLWLSRSLNAAISSIFTAIAYIAITCLNSVFGQHRGTNRCMLLCIWSFPLSSFTEMAFHPL